MKTSKFFWKIILLCLLSFQLVMAKAEMNHPVSDSTDKASELRLSPSDFEDCIDLKKFDYMDMTPFPETPTTRKLGQGENAPEVSVEEGYRIRYSYRKMKFLDIKIEYPVEGRFEEDMNTLSEFYKKLGEDGKDDIKLTYFEDLYGYEAYVLDRYKPLSRFLFLSINCLFDKDNERIIYVYYWNINREKEIFNSINDFLDLKVTSFESLIDCLK